MANRPAASLDGPGRMVVRETPRPHRTVRPSIIATVGPRTPALDELDLIRIDAAHGSLQELCSLRERYDCPTLLDLPGPETRHRTSLLTTTEFCLFASAESIEWVGLRGVGSLDEVFRAREVLDPSIRVASSVSRPHLLTDAEWEAIAAASDALVLPFDDLRADLGFERTVEHLERALVVSAKRQRPLLIRGGLLSTMLDSVMPELDQLEILSSMAEAGCAGFILTEETTNCPHARLCVETLRMVLGPLCREAPREFGVARVARRSSAHTDEALPAIREFPIKRG